MARNPLTAVPATRSSLPLLRYRRRIVVGVVVAAAISGPITTVMTLSHHTAAPTTVTLPDQSAVSLAQTVAQDFLAARKSAVPAAKDVSSDFSTVPGVSAATTVRPLNVQSLTFASSAPYLLGQPGTSPVETEQETFNALINGQLYAVTVPMEKTSAGWVLGAAPSVAPTSVAPDQSSDGIDYSQLYSNTATNTPLPQGYQTQIKSWAQTYASAGHASPALLSLTGDQGNRTYSGLNGWTLLLDPQIKAVLQVKPSSAGPAGYIVRVGLVLRPPAANGPTLSTDYDLYLESDKSAQQPPVIAWGAAGSYRSLQPYMNADQH